MSTLSKKGRCQNWKLYVIADAKAAKEKPLTEIVRSALEGGADVIQLRDKEASDLELVAAAKALLEITRPKGIPLIINDRIQVARDSGAEGVHLGQEDGSLEGARTILGSQAIIGRSTHSRSQALEAQTQGFDYIGIGPVFQTPTKPDTPPVGLKLVRFAAKNIHIPFVAIGGIDVGNIREVRRAGAKAVAVVRAVVADENPRRAAKKLADCLTERDRNV